MLVFACCIAIPKVISRRIAMNEKSTDNGKRIKEVFWGNKNNSFRMVIRIFLMLLIWRGLLGNPLRIHKPGVPHLSRYQHR